MAGPHKGLTDMKQLFFMLALLLPVGAWAFPAQVIMPSSAAPTGGGPSGPPVFFTTTNNLGVGANTTATQSLNVGSGANRCLIVKIGFWFDTVARTVSVTYNGTTMTRVPNSPSGDFISALPDGDYCDCFYLMNSASGTHDIVVTFSGQVGGIAVCGEAYSNVNQSSGVGNLTYSGAVGNQTGWPASVSITGSSTQMVLDMMSWNSSPASIVTHTGRVQTANTLGSGVNLATSYMPGPVTIMDWSASSGPGSDEHGLAAFTLQGL